MNRMKMFYRPGWMDARVLRTAEEGLGLLMTWSCQVARGSPLALLLEGEAWGSDIGVTGEEEEEEEEEK